MKIFETIKNRNERNVSSFKSLLECLQDVQICIHLVLWISDRLLVHVSKRPYVFAFFFPRNNNVFIACVHDLSPLPIASSTDGSCEDVCVWVFFLLKQIFFHQTSRSRELIVNGFDSFINSRGEYTRYLTLKLSIYFVWGWCMCLLLIHYHIVNLLEWQIYVRISCSAKW